MVWWRISVGGFKTGVQLLSVPVSKPDTSSLASFHSICQRAIKDTAGRNTPEFGIVRSFRTLRQVESVDRGRNTLPFPLASDLADDTERIDDGYRQSIDPMIEYTDRTEKMQREVLNLVASAWDRYANKKDRASFIRKEFAKKHSEFVWDCVIGQFSSYATYQKKHYIYLNLGHVYMLLYKLRVSG